MRSFAGYICLLDAFEVELFFLLANRTLAPQSHVWVSSDANVRFGCLNTMGKRGKGDDTQHDLHKNLLDEL